MSTSSKTPLKLGILGLGEGRSLIHAALNSKLIELAQICDLNENLCKDRADEFNLPSSSWTLDYHDLLNNDNIDIIGIYTPDRFHAEHIIQALKSGKHVICTKPLFSDLSRAKEVFELSRQMEKRVFVGQSSRFFEPFIQQRADYENKQLGDLITAEAHYNGDMAWFLRKGMTEPKTFKLLYGCGSHPVDLIRWYLPDIEEVMGYGSLSQNGRKEGLTHEDTMHFCFKTSDGRVARMSGSYGGPTQPNTLAASMSCVLRGEMGCSQADYPDLRYGRKITKEGISKEGGNKYDITNFDFSDKSDYYFPFGGIHHHAGEFQNYLEYFFKCIHDGTVPKPDIAEGVKTMATMYAMEESLRSGQSVRVDSILNRYDFDFS